jgi:hypothetical protein
MPVYMPVCHVLSKPILDLHQVVKFTNIFIEVLMYQDFM